MTELSGRTLARHAQGSEFHPQHNTQSYGLLIICQYIVILSFICLCDGI
jgi:hypothetical protein